MTDCSLNTIPRHDHLRDLQKERELYKMFYFQEHVPFIHESHHVLLISSPFLEDLQRLTSMQHTWCGKHDLQKHTSLLYL